MRIVKGNFKDLGDGFKVLRILPHIDARNIGPFIFVDHFGPVPLKTGHELVVRPHPHIGLATITYLYDGLILHKDSLGSSELIRPGEVNWMTAGRGIVHSEHSQADSQHKQMEGIQTWVALPLAHEEAAPAFDHYAAGVIPEIKMPGAVIRLIAGSLMGKSSPVKILSPLFYADLEMKNASGASLEFPANQEAAIYVSRGTLECAGLKATVGEMLVCEPGSRVTVVSEAGARAVLMGGAKLDAPRHLWWNFVSSSKERIEQAKRDWLANTMGVVAGESDRIPLPG